MTDQSAEDPKSCTAPIIVEWRSKSCRRATKKRQLQRLMIANSDICAAKDACEFLLVNPLPPSHRLQYALAAAIVICYSCPFTASRRNSLGCLPGEWTKFKNPKLQLAHDTLLKARGEIVAHSDSETRQIKIYPPNIKPKGPSLPKSSRIAFAIKTYTLSQSQIKNSLDACEDLIARIMPEIEQLLEEIYGKMELPQREFVLRINEGF
jgi:hypothetical protein